MSTFRRLLVGSLLCAPLVVQAVPAAAVTTTIPTPAAVPNAQLPKTALPAHTLGMKPDPAFLDHGALVAAETLLRRDIRWTVQMLDKASPNKMIGSAYGQLVRRDAALVGPANDINLVISVPLGFGEHLTGSRDPAGVRRMLTSVAGGTYDAAYRTVAGYLVRAGHADAVIRLGWEFDGAWNPWSAHSGNHDVYAMAFRHVHDVFAAVSPAFRFDFNSMRIDWLELGRLAYPGDAYVDIISMDVYYRGERYRSWNETKWNDHFVRPIRDQQAFARQRGKQVAYPEWAVSNTDEPRFVERMWALMAALPDSGAGSLAYHSWFNTVAAYNLRNFPKVRERYVALFGDRP